jgi:uncharacterized phage protein (TIGR01671 family)
VREIKFRAWDKLNKCWLEFGPGLLNYFVAWKTHKEFEVSGRGHYEICQFTGLKDQNKKEIYELDIVKTYENEIGEVIFDSGEFVIKISGDYYSFDDLWSLKYGYLFEVIGNVFENPELLEDK